MIRGVAKGMNTERGQGRARGFNRRESLMALGTLVAGAALPVRAQVMPMAADSSALIYITPLRSNGGESRCQAEVWFVRDGGALYVVTAADAWRAEAVGRGLATARIWVGDVGVWDDEARYKQLPAVMGAASFETEPAAHAMLLDKFGAKYSREWGTWGPRFQKGLADGSRVMLKYQIS